MRAHFVRIVCEYKWCRGLGESGALPSGLCSIKKKIKKVYSRVGASGPPAS